MITPKVFTVTQLNAHIGAMIGSDPELQMIFIEGELSNLSVNRGSGHMYFSVKDSKSVVRAVMFSWYANKLRFQPKDGMKVIMRAQVSVYEPMGHYQLRVEDMQPDGVGVLALQLEQLKQKLNAEGLFDPAHKKPIPKIPRTVGVITSPTGAALRDIMQIIHRRYPLAQIVLAPVLVQGDSAPAQLINAVDTFSTLNSVDVLIIGRGGGSMEDLWAFNDEGLARAIYHCKIPVISAVGHETDVTICDFVSDLRAPTPSAAAELAVPILADLLNNCDGLMRFAQTTVHSRIDLVERDLNSMKAVISAKTPHRWVAEHKAAINALALRAKLASQIKYQHQESVLKELSAKLEALNPIAVLNRGYAHLEHDGHAVRSVNEVKAGDILTITLSDGTITAAVIE